MAGKREQEENFIAFWDFWGMGRKFSKDRNENRQSLKTPITPIVFLTRI